MDRRKSIKALTVGAISSGILLDACKSEGPAEKAASPSVDKQPVFTLDRQPEETKRYDELVAQTFFTDHELATITILADIIIPADDVSGSASQAGVPAFIEFIVKDMPEHQTPMRGGLRWLDLRAFQSYGLAFKDCTQAQQLEMVDQIAYPAKAKPEHAQGVAFFSLMRNLTASGFYTSQIGVKDIGYAGNTPNQWNGVPDDVLKQYNLAYSERELKESVKFD